MTAALTRWTPLRKAAVCDAIRHGDVSFADALRIHGLTDNELSSWLAAYEQRGTEGLRVTKRNSGALTASPREVSG